MNIIVNKRSTEYLYRLDIACAKYMEKKKTKAGQSAKH